MELWPEEAVKDALKSWAHGDVGIVGPKLGKKAA